MAEQTIEQLKNERKVLLNDIFKSDIHGKRIYLLGSAEFGPTNEPVLIKSSVGLYNKFGKQGTLIDAFHALKYTSKDNEVYLVKTTGEHSTAYLNVNIQGGEIIENGLVIAAYQSNELFNDVKILIDIDKIRISFPEECKIETLDYSYQDYPTIDKLTTAINKDTRQKRSYVYAYSSVETSTPTKHAFFSCNATEVFMYGGQCGLNYSKNLLYNCLANTYSILESHNIDIIVPVDAFLDDIYPDDSEGTQHLYNKAYYQTNKDYLTKDFTGKQLTFMNQLLQFCIVQFNFGMVTTGIMGFNSNHEYWSNYLSESDDIVKMYMACYKYNLSCCDNVFYAFLLSIVAGDIKYNRGTIIDNGYLAYAALCASTVITSGITNLPISNTVSLYNEFSENMLEQMADSGLVTFRHSAFYDEVVVYDGITASSENKNLKLYCNVRMIQLCMSYINRLFQFYVGYDIIMLIKEGVIIEDLNNVLRYLSTKGVITTYDFTIVPSYGKGEVKVYLNFMTQYMIKPIQICSVINAEFDEGGIN